MDWDKLRIFHAAAEAGSFTHAADTLNLSQSAISRQVSSLEHDVGVPLFHRHARGLILTEQGELLFRTAHDVLRKLEVVSSQLKETKERPSGKLRVTTTVAFGAGWLTEHIHEFMDEYPEVELELILQNEELDIGMREADVAIRLHQPQQSDLIQRKVFTMHMHVYASPEYLRRYGTPQSLDDLDSHRLIMFGDNAPGYLKDINWLGTAGKSGNDRRDPALVINSVLAIKRAVRNGAGIAVLPDYVIKQDSTLVQILPESSVPSFDAYFCYPEEMRKSAKLTAFRDFLVSKAKNWNY